MALFNSKFSGLNIEYKVYLFVLLVVTILATIVNYSNPLHFNRFLGNLNPFLVFIISGTMGFAVLSNFLKKRGFYIFKTEYFKLSFRHIWLIIPFASIAIMVDCKMVFPMDINIPYPESLLFYPSIAFIVEMAFHLLPIAILLFILTAIFKAFDKEKIIWICIFVVALIEPSFQIAMDVYPTWALIITWMNLYLFNLTQLFIFKNFGFMPMYFFRLSYYLIWHIIWGHYRLDLLF